MGIVEKGKISKPDRDGKLIPQISTSKNKSARLLVFELLEELLELGKFFA